MKEEVILIYSLGSIITKHSGTYTLINFTKWLLRNYFSYTFANNIDFIIIIYLIICFLASCSNKSYNKISKIGYCFMFIVEYDNYTTGSSYEANNLVNNKLSKHWSTYKSGKNLDTSDILFAGSSESVFIVSQFTIKYYYYKNDTEFNLVWRDSNNSFSYQATFNVEDIEKKNTLTEIENSLKSKGLI